MPARNSSSDNAALLEKFVQQRVVRFGDEFDQFAMQLRDALFPFARRRLLAKFPVPVGVVGHDFAAQHVEHLVEAGPGIDRHVQRKDLRPVVRARVGQHFVEMRVLFVHRVDDDDFRDAAVGRAIPHPLRADADAVLRMHHHEREVRDPQRRERLADEIEITRRVDDVELLAQPLHVQQRSLRGDLALLLADVIIRNRGAIGDAAHAPDDARAREHGLAEHGFAGGGVTDDGEIPKIPCRRCGHNSNLFLL